MGGFYRARHIINNVWIGSAADSVSKAFMREKDVHMIINCTRDIPFRFKRVINMRVPVDDNPAYENVMAQALPQAVDAIEMGVASGRGILVHCYAGQQRSSTVVAAYLMKTLGLEPERAVSLIKSIKPETFPMRTFVRSLQAYYNDYLTEKVASVSSRRTRLTPYNNNNNNYYEVVSPPYFDPPRAY
jgi:dual specificity MAP kinase phosphatase